MKKIGRLRIDGWQGQHDEAGASIRNEDNTIHFSTPGWDTFGMNWDAYTEFAEVLVARWNAQESNGTATQHRLRLSAKEGRPLCPNCETACDWESAGDRDTETMYGLDVEYLWCGNCDQHWELIEGSMSMCRKSH
jgi:hypothetical protein